MEMRKLNRKLLILIAIAPVGCLAGLLFGLFIGWQLLPVEYTNTEIGDLSPSDTEELVVMVATEFCSGGDVARAHLRLTELDVANPEQYVAYLADKYVQEGRGAGDRDTMDLVCLAEGLNVSSQSMVAYVAHPGANPHAAADGHAGRRAGGGLHSNSPGGECCAHGRPTATNRHAGTTH